MRLAGPVIALVVLVFALLPASAGATSECKNLANCASNTGEWVEIQPHAANQFTALGCPGTDQVAVGLDWGGPAVDKVFVNMAGDQGRGPWGGMFLHLSNRTATPQAVQVVIGCIPRASGTQTSAPEKTKTTALHEGTATTVERCRSGDLVEGGSTAEFGGDQPPTKAQLDAVEVTNHIPGDELVTKTEVGADAAGAPVELQQDVVCK